VTRYFFDLVDQHRSDYDYAGRFFPTLEKAYQHAELLALDFSVDEDDRCASCKISVRSAEGHEFFSTPVRQSSLIAA